MFLNSWEKERLEWFPVPLRLLGSLRSVLTQVCLFISCFNLQFPLIMMLILSTGAVEESSFDSMAAGGRWEAAIHVLPFFSLCYFLFLDIIYRDFILDRYPQHIS